VFPQLGTCPQHWRKVLRHVEAKQRSKPKNSGDSYGHEQQLCVVEEWQCIVAQKGDDEVVVQRKKI
jgi:CRISPR/Cas system-associated exonuclease Cas4 (RecB family)